MQTKSDRFERRRSFRIIYLPGERPVIRTIDALFEVLDLSREGVRLLLPDSLEIPDPFGGRLFFPTGHHLHVTGRISEKRANDPGVFVRCPISPSLVTAEKKRVSI